VARPARAPQGVDTSQDPCARTAVGEEVAVVKKAVLLLIVAFAIYSVIATPRDAADAVRTAGEGLQSAAGSLIEFFQALTP
jgi:hypothetical protein